MLLHGTASARAVDGVVDPRTDELAAIIGRTRGYALSVGALALACATAPTPEDRAAHAEELAANVDRYVAALAHGRQATRLAGGSARVVEERRVVQAFAEAITALPRDGEGITRQAAIDLARQSRRDVLPAIYRILAVIQEDEVAAIERQMQQVREKAALVDGMFTEMGRVTKMIALISINASVEAARTGGASGRTFQVIAEEVRTLARRSTEMLDRMRASLAEDAAPRTAAPQSLTAAAGPASRN